MPVIQTISPEELRQHVEQAMIPVQHEVNEIKKKLDNLTEAQKPTEYLTVNQTAALIGVSTVTIRSYAKQGILTKYMIGRRIRYKRHEVEAAILQINNRQTTSK